MNFKIFAFNLFFAKFSIQLSCLNEKGSPVDWFIVYKLPKIETSDIEELNSGYGYAFITDKTLNTVKDWTLSSIYINEKDSIFGQTIGAVITDKKKTDLSYVAFNDESPEAKNSGTLAHAKGLFAIDSKGGFLLSHSVPKFPSLKTGYKYPETGVKNGQTAICISLDAKDTITLNSIATNLLMMRPNIYGIKIEDSLVDRSQLFLDLEDKHWIETESSIENTIQSKKGVVFTAFSKSKDFEDDLYSGLIGPHFKKDFLVQSWRNGAGSKLVSECKEKYHVQNVQRIILSIVDKADWEYTEDHSKWAITSDTTGKSYTCIADINRVKSQFKRGGGSLCMDSKQVWKIFKSSVEEVESCSIKSRKKSSNFGSNGGSINNLKLEDDNLKNISLKNQSKSGIK